MLIRSNKIFESYWNVAFHLYEYGILFSVHCDHDDSFNAALPNKHKQCPITNFQNRKTGPSQSSFEDTLDTNYLVSADRH